MKHSRPLSRRDHFIFSNYRIVHAVRVTLAFVLTLYLTRYLGLPESAWILLSLVVVITPISFVGNVSQRAWHRVFGTLIGALSGYLAIWLSHHAHWAMILWCALVIFSSAYFARGQRPYVGLLIGVTLAVTIGGGDRQLDIALWRGVDVAIGCGLALLFCYIYPQLAFHQWRLRSEAVTRGLVTLYQKQVEGEADIPLKHKAQQQQISALSSLIAPASKETHLNPALFEAVLAQLVNTRHILELLASETWLEGPWPAAIQAPLNQCRQISIHALEEIADAMLQATPPPAGQSWPEEELAEALTQYAQQQPVAQQRQLHGYLWLNLRLIKEIKELRQLSSYLMMN
ncbi:FUSC family protein [Ferrimonas gelatinilytica]|uniref:FUSC family protein n=1 Tax=Ferrimonas gelatinilytica TaxID=1255257 RepID=A0ABP9RSP9_9GAMM